MSNRRFIADIGRFKDLTERKLLAVAKQATDEIVQIAQNPVGRGGPMPVDTGTLRNSLVVELNGAKVGEGADSYVLGIADLELGDVVTVAWTADYAVPRHYKPPSFGQGGGMWRDVAADRWQDTVRAVAIRASKMK